MTVLPLYSKVAVVRSSEPTCCVHFVIRLLLSYVAEYVKLAPEELPSGCPVIVEMSRAPDGASPPPGISPSAVVACCSTVIRTFVPPDSNVTVALRSTPEVLTASVTETV